MHLDDIEEEDPEPEYVLFGLDPGTKTARYPTNEEEDDTLNVRCQDCAIDYCDEYLHGGYCACAVKRYWEENKYTATVRNAYVVWITHYNRRLDNKSYRDNLEGYLRDSQMSKPPLCMKDGSLKFSLQWIKWQIENGLMKDHYDQERAKRRRVRENKEAKRLAEMSFRYHGQDTSKKRRSNRNR